MERIFDLKSQDLVEKPVLKINFCDDIEKYVQTDTKASGCKSPSSPQFNDIKKEWKGFDLLGQRSKNLELLFQALNSISPTSVPSEREFSKSSNIMTPFRSRFTDESLDSISILKDFFHKQKE